MRGKVQKAKYDATSMDNGTRPKRKSFLIYKNPNNEIGKCFIGIQTKWKLDKMVDT